MRAFAALALALVLASGALGLAIRSRRVSAVVQLVGAAGFVLVALTHVAEALELLPWMGWGRPGSPGHYLDLAGAAAAVLFPVGYLIYALTSPGR